MKQSQKRGYGKGAGIVLFLLAFMVLLGCPTGGSTDPEPTPDSEPPTTGGGPGGSGSNGNNDSGSKTAAQAASELANSLGAAYDGDVTVTLNGNLQVGTALQSQQIRVAKEQVTSLDIPNGVILVVPDNYKLTVEATGKVDVKPSAVLKVVGTAEVKASGSIAVEAAGEILVESSVNKGLTVAGTVTIANNASLVAESGPVPVAANATVTIATGASLVVESSTVTVNGKIEAAGEVTVAAAATVKVESGGELAVKETGALETAVNISGVTADNGAEITAKGENVTVTAKEGNLLPPVLKSETVSYSETTPTLTFTFDSASSATATPDTVWGTPQTESNVVTVTLAQNAAANGERSLTLVVTNSAGKSTTLTRTIPGSATPTAGDYTIVSYSGGDTATLKSGGVEKLYYIGGTDKLKALIDAIYTPNAPSSGADEVESGKTAVAYTSSNKADLSDKVLGLFTITVPATGDPTVKIKGTDLPTTATGASSTKLIVIDIGKPGDNATSNAALPVFIIPNQGLGTSGGSYGHIRLRVNNGASLTIEANNSGYISSGSGNSCPTGYFNNGCVEVLAGGKLRDGAYEGFPLGANAVILNRFGSYLSVGPDPDSDDAKATTNKTSTAYQTYYAGYLLGPPSGTNGEAPRVVWETTDSVGGSYLEVRPGEIATNAKLTVNKLLGLIYSVWFVDNGGFTVSTGATLAANGLTYKFYGNSNTTITLAKKNGGSAGVLDKRFLDLEASGSFGDAEGAANVLTGGESDAKVIRLNSNPASGKRKSYASGTTSPVIQGYCDWNFADSGGTN